MRLNQKMFANFDLIPPGASPLLIKPRSIDDVPILALTLWSKRYGDCELRHSRVAGVIESPVYELRLKEGMPPDQAVIDAGAVRFRPMVLTAAAVIVGSTVILFDPIFQGLAVALMAGEIVSLALSRMTVPGGLLHRQPKKVPMTIHQHLRLIAGSFVLINYQFMLGNHAMRHSYHHLTRIGSALAVASELKTGPAG